MASLQLFLSVVFTIVATAARRLMRGPRLPGWTVRFELAVAVVRRVVAAGAAAGPQVLRRRFVGTPVSRELRSRMVRSDAPWAGGGAQAFTPVGWREVDPTILYFPGGGYVAGSPQTHRDLLARLCVAAAARVVAINYRKAPEHPFPDAIDDGEASYRALLTAPVPPDRLFVAGDSAGGGLALAVALRARDAGMPLPRALLLISPWTDLASGGESMEQNAPFDYIGAGVLKQIGHTYLQGADAAHPHGSAIHADLRGLPPLFVQSGGAEVLLSDNQALVARATGAGVRVVHDVEATMVHVFPAFVYVQPQPGQAALARLGEFVRRESAQSTPPAHR